MVVLAAQLLSEMRVCSYREIVDSFESTVRSFHVHVAGKSARSA